MTEPLSPEGEAALIGREAVKTKAYRDSVGIWTIGVGHTAGAGAPIPKAGMVITYAEAIQIFRRDVLVYAAAVDKGCGNTKLAVHQRDALISLIYNVGVGYATGKRQSQIFKAVQRGDLDAVPALILKFRKPDEIMTRRRAESQQFATPYSVSLPKARINDKNVVKVKDVGVARATPQLNNPAIDTFRPTVITGMLADLRNKFFGRAPNVTVAHTMPPGFRGDMLTGEIQATLRAKGFPEVGTIDGFYGEDTRQAIRNLIRFNGGDPDAMPERYKMTKATLDYVTKSKDKPKDAARELASVTQVKQSVPEVVRPLNTLTGIGFTSLFGGGMFTAVDKAKSTLDSVKDTADSASSAIVSVKPLIEGAVDVTTFISGNSTLLICGFGALLLLVVAGQTASVIQLFRTKRIN